MKIKKHLKSILQIKIFRIYYCYFRFQILKYINGIRTINETKNIINGTINYNKKALSNIITDLTMKRQEWLTFLILSLEQINIDSKILIIGPRTENEIIHLESYGFRNIYSIDLISYSKKIDLQDMHNMNFEDNTFDLVCMGWTISYSENPKKAINEIIRILKNNSLFLSGVEYIDFENNQKGKDIIQKNRINTTKDFIDLFGKNFSKIIFQNDAPHRFKKKCQIKKITNLDSTQTITCLEIKK